MVEQTVGQLRLVVLGGAVGTRCGSVVAAVSLGGKGLPTLPWAAGYAEVLLLQSWGTC